MARPDVDVLSRLLEQALALAPEPRDRFLDDACRGDGDLRQELEALVSSHEQSAGYFEQLASAIVVPALVAVANDAADEILPGQTVSHYEIIEKLGAGGMGVVFKARDLRLRRFVALKFLPRHLSADAAAKARFVVEAQSASALDHPNIAVVHEIDETEEGRLFIVMAYYEGATLDRKYTGAGLPLSDVLDMAQQIGGALAAAHGKGIVHRDVKPSNILITSDGTAKLLDFGIAKLVHWKDSGRTAALGTLAYMSPEQLRGDDVDHRTDVWSLGIVIYEMLTGIRPFRADDEEALADSVRYEEPQRVDRVKREVPAALAAIVERCLAKNPDRRYSGIKELLADLRALEPSGFPHPRAASKRRNVFRYASATVLLLGLAVSGTIYFERVRTRETARQLELRRGARNRLAVLPLAISGLNSAESFLADAIMAELIAHLSRRSGLRVIAPSSVRRYRNSGSRMVDIARELSVGALLQGTLHKDTTGMQITLQLVDPRTEEQLWTGSYPVDIGQLQALHRDVAQRIADVLQVEPEPGEDRRLAMPGTSNSDAYVLCLKGRHFLAKGDPAAVGQARDYFQQALDLDPTYAQAWSGLADAFHMLGVVSPLPAADAYPRAKAAAERALQIDAGSPEAHVSLGTALAYYYWDFETAARHYRRAIELNPSHADAHRLHAEYLRYQGRFDDALFEAAQAEALDPLSPGSHIEQGITLYLARRYDEAITRFRRLLSVSPNFTYTHFFLALVHVQKQEYERAREALEKAGKGQRQHDIVTLRAYIDAVTGRIVEARQALETLKSLSPQPHAPSWHLAVIHVGLGERERALDLLEQAARDRAWEVRLLPVEPLFDSLRSHPRFRTVVENVRSRSASPGAFAH